MNFKSIVAGFTAVALLAGAMVSSPVAAQTVDAEFDGALAEAYAKGLTKYNTVETFRPFDSLTREQAAKFLSVYAAKEMCILPDTSMSCSFSDVPADPTLAGSVRTACQQGILMGSGGEFYPTAYITKSQLAMGMARIIASADDSIDSPSEDGAYWYEDAYNILWDGGITNDTNPANWERPILRYEALYFITRASGVECSDDITDLLEDIFGDDDTDMEEGDDTDEGDEVFETSNGEAMVTLSPLTPAGDTVPGLASVWVASYDFSADDEDVILENIVLERFGLGNREVIQDVTLLVNNDVVSKSRTFNSDAELNTSLNPSVMIEAGETVRLDVVVTVGDVVNDSISNQEFQIGLTDFETNGAEVKSNLPLKANKFEVAGINASRVTVTPDGTVSDVELGEMAAEVAKFELENEGEDAVYITHITLEDDEKNADDNLANFQLTHNNQVVATTASTNGKYLSFVLDTPVMIDENETEDFKVRADVVEGAGDQISFIIDETIYVRGYDERFGYGIATVIDPAYNCPGSICPQTFAINAGELTLVELNNERDEIRRDTDNFVIAAFDLNVNAGQDLILEDILFTIQGIGGATFSGLDLSAHFDEVQLVVMSANSRRTYDLNIGSPTGTSFTASDDDLGISLPDAGKVTILVEVDSISTIPVGSIGDKFEARLVATDLRIEESQDDERVNDIVPSSITFDSITFVNSNVDLEGIRVKDVDVVRGAENVDAVMFEVETDDVSGVYIQSFTVEEKSFTAGTGGGATSFSQDLVNAVRLWKKVGGTWELVEENGGFDISANAMTFDDFADIFVPVASSQVFLVTVDISDDDANQGTSFELRLSAADIDDDDNKQLTVNLPVDSDRVITITGAGELTIQADNSDSVINNTPKYILAGRTSAQSEFVASFELTAENEGAEIEDLTLTVSGAGLAEFQDAVTEVEIYDEDKTTLLYTETVNSNVVEFNNINLIVDEGSTNIYVKIVTEPIGDNFNGASAQDLTFAISVSQVDGVSSGDLINPTNGPTIVSEEFSVVPVRFSNVEFVNSAEGVNIDNPAAGPDQTIAILMMQADTWVNTQRNDGSSLELVLDQIKVQNSNNTNVIDLRMRRLDVSGSTYFADGADGVFSLTGQALNIREVDSGEAAYFEIIGTLTGVTVNTSTKISLIGIDNPASEAVIYSPSDIPGEDYTALYIGVSQRQGPSITIES